LGGQEEGGALGRRGEIVGYADRERANDAVWRCGWTRLITWRGDEANRGKRGQDARATVRLMRTPRNKSMRTPEAGRKRKTNHDDGLHMEERGDAREVRLMRTPRNKSMRTPEAGRKCKTNHDDGPYMEDEQDARATRKTLVRQRRGGGPAGEGLVGAGDDVCADCGGVAAGELLLERNHAIRLQQAIQNDVKPIVVGERA
jgi:hypothetical protein